MASKNWQLAEDAAKRYEAVLVPAILGPFAKALVDFALLPSEGIVVDVGCGTGAATRYAAQKAGSNAKVIGSDVNAGMLAVASSLPGVDGATIDWQEASAYALPMDDGVVDAVLCAQSLQFIAERVKALEEMRRVLKPGKSAYISLWTPIEASPYFHRLVGAVADLISEDTAAGLGSAFNFSDRAAIEATFDEVAFSDVSITTTEIELPLAPVREFVPRHIRATPMGKGYDAAPEETRIAILDRLAEQLAEYETSNGMSVPFASFLIRATK